MEVVPRHFQNQDWITLTFVFSLCIVVFVKVNYPKEFYNFSRLLSTNKYFTESYKSTTLFGFFAYALFFAQALLVSLGVYFFVLHLNFVDRASPILYLKIALIYTVLVVSKYLVEKILGVLFSIEKFLDDYIFYKLTYKNFIGLALLPVLIVLTYLWGGTTSFYRVAVLLFLGLNLFIIGAFYRRRRPLITSNLFYIILYLCSFEIAPYYILYKIVV